MTAEASAPGLALPSGGTVLIAAETAASPQHHFTGKLEDPAILHGFVASWPDVGATLGLFPAADGRLGLFRTASTRRRSTTSVRRRATADW